MPRPAKVATVETVAVQEVKPQVINAVIAGARRCDATTRDGSILEGAVVLFRDAIPALIDGEEKAVNKKWFAVNSIIDALIMSEDDAVAERVSAVLEGNFMALRGLTAKISVFTGEDEELRYKVEF